MAKKEHIPSTVALLTLGAISLLQKEGVEDIHGAVVMKKGCIHSGSFYPGVIMLEERGMIYRSMEGMSSDYQSVKLLRTPLMLTEKGERFVDEYGLEKLVGIVPFSKFK